MSILLALLVFGVLIFIHELGHFLAARACGVGILEFSIGMGPKLLSKKSQKTGTVYSLRLFPIGGYVSMLGENGMEAVQGDNGCAELADGSDFLINSVEDTDQTVKETKPIDPEIEKHAYCNQSVWRRILISVAGPFMNVFLGFVMMFVIVLAAGEGAVGTTKIGGFYVQYSAESAEDEEGLRSGDYINYVKDTAEGAEKVRGCRFQT